MVCAGAGQAEESLHTMAVLKAYQADLFKDLDEGEVASLEVVKKFLGFVLRSYTSGVLPSLLRCTPPS